MRPAIRAKGAMRFMEKAVIVQQTQQEHAPPTLDFAMDLVRWAEDKKAENIHLYDVKDLCSYADYVLICSGNSDRHVSAIAETLREEGKHAGHMPLGVEGLHKAQWVLLDFGDVVIHVFFGPVREYYDLDRLWPAKAKIWSGGEPTSTPESEDDEDL